MKWALDKLDYKILETVAAHHGMSIMDVNRQVPGVKYSTCKYRIDNLIKARYIKARKETKIWKLFKTQKAQWHMLKQQQEA